MMNSLLVGTNQIFNSSVLALISRERVIYASYSVLQRRVAWPKHG
jgi:hypothetical protein